MRGYRQATWVTREMCKSFIGPAILSAPNISLTLSMSSTHFYKYSGLSGLSRRVSEGGRDAAAAAGAAGGGYWQRGRKGRTERGLLGRRGKEESANFTRKCWKR